MSEKPILLVEDNEELLRTNKRMLELNGYVVETAPSLAEARRAAAQTEPALVVLDIILPDGSGLDFCAELRAHRPGLPVIFLTALGDSDDIIAGLRAGGDDYLPKPYDYTVLLARIEALLRRARALPQKTGPRLGPLHFDHAAQRACLDGRDMLLKPREYALLYLMSENPGVYFSPEHLYQTVWGGSPNGDVRTVYAHISSLRRKLEALDSGQVEIVHKRGPGYCLIIR